MNFLQIQIKNIADIIYKELDIKEAISQNKINVMVTAKCLEEVQKFIESELKEDSLKEFREDTSRALGSKDHLLYITTILMYLEEIPQYSYLLEGRLLALKTDILYKLEKYNDRKISTTN